MLKALGILLIAVSAFFVAITLISELDRSARSASAARLLLERVKNMIECYALPASEILKRIEPNVFAELGYHQGTPDSFFELARESDIADLESAELLLAFAKDFGRSYRKDELSRCALYLERLRSREQKLLKEAAKKRKIIITISMCAALSLIILLW